MKEKHSLASRLRWFLSTTESTFYSTTSVFSSHSSIHFTSLTYTLIHSSLLSTMIPVLRAEESKKAHKPNHPASASISTTEMERRERENFFISNRSSQQEKLQLLRNSKFEVEEKIFSKGINSSSSFFFEESERREEKKMLKGSAHLGIGNDAMMMKVSHFFSHSLFFT